ncbi:hypothetical protein [Amycolatopsis sp. cg9]|uniref:hypothetical protein n=1 Tax=Amycolatopsis sp. cg9 TaxID=3238801 RepID=UPI0035246002
MLHEVGLQPSLFERRAELVKLDRHVGDLPAQGPAHHLGDLVVVEFHRPVQRIRLPGVRFGVGQNRGDAPALVLGGDRRASANGSRSSPVAASRKLISHSAKNVGRMWVTAPVKWSRTRSAGQR